MAESSNSLDLNPNTARSNLTAPSGTQGDISSTLNETCGHLTETAKKTESSVQEMLALQNESEVEVKERVVQIEKMIRELADTRHTAHSKTDHRSITKIKKQCKMLVKKNATLRKKSNAKVLQAFQAVKTLEAQLISELYGQKNAAAAAQKKESPQTQTEAKAQTTTEHSSHLAAEPPEVVTLFTSPFECGWKNPEGAP